MNFFLELLKKEELHSIPGFEEGLKRIDDLLKNREKHYDGRDYDKAYDVLCKLCCLLFKQGKLELIKDLVTIESKQEYFLEDISYLTKSIPFISGFCFGSAVRKMQTMLASWNQKNPPDWMIWKRLCNAAWAWNASMDIFEKKELKLSSTILLKRSNREKGISIDIKEMHVLKTAKNQSLKPDRYFSKDRF